ncbi:acyl-CoA-binding protein [Haematococcus lacustris]|nr:hypothetical protein QJQ45_019928 [Haematococcus lacustris]
MGLQEDFDAAAKSVKELSQSPTNDELLQLYALFKQGSVGDINTAKPGILDQKGRAKWSAWEAKKGMSKEDAMAEYIKLAETMKAKYDKA